MKFIRNSCFRSRDACAKTEFSSELKGVRKLEKSKTMSERQQEEVGGWTGRMMSVRL